MYLVIGTAGILILLLLVLLICCICKRSKDDDKDDEEIEDPIEQDEKEILEDKKIQDLKPSPVLQ